MGRDADPDGDAPDPLWEAGSYYDAAFAQRRRRRAEARAAAERAGVLIVFSCGWLGVLGPAAVAVFVAFTAGRLGSDDVAGLALVLSINAFPPACAAGACGTWVARRVRERRGGRWPLTLTDAVGAFLGGLLSVPLCGGPLLVAAVLAA